MQLPLWRRLSLQITVPIILLMLAVLLSLSLYILKAQQEEAFERAELELRSMLMVAQGSLNRIFAGSRLEVVAEMLSEVYVHPRVEHAVILNPEGELMRHYALNTISPQVNNFVAGIPKQLLHEASRSGVTTIEYHPEHKHFMAVVPILQGQQLEAAISRNLFVVAYHHDNQWIQTSSLVLRELLLLLMVLALLGVLLWLGLQIVVVRPVRDIIHMLDKFARREPIGNLRNKSYNELGNLSEALIQAATARDEYEKKLRRLTAAVEQSSDSIVITNLDARIEYVNKAFTDITGYSADEVIGRNPKILASGNTPKTTYDSMWSTLTAGKVWQGELYNRRKDGSEYREWATISPLFDEQGEVRNYLASKQNITERRAAEAQIHHLAFYDVLTGLPNRANCTEIIQDMLKARESRKFGAVVLLDLDGLQRINDVRGFEFGDKLLLKVSERLRLLAEHEQGAQLGNLGGDLFALILPPVGEREHVLAHTRILVKEALEDIARPILIEGESVTITSSAGMVLYPEYSDTPEAIIRHAETAVHSAKEKGGNQLTIYNPAYSYELEQRFEIERELREAIATNQLELYVQPQQRIHGELVGVEVLCRWHHPERGMVSPGVFIAIAEMSDLIVDLGNWILSEALEALAQMPSNLTLAINISPRQFRKFDFVYLVERQLLRTGADPKRLILEVTENLFVDDLKDIALKMKTLSESGVQFSIDDFGTGYSSLSYLSDLPLHELKIDQSFVQGVGDENKEKIVETVISMGGHLDLRVVAEGVETQAQLNFLRSQSVDVICQGYYFAKPLPIKDFLAQQSKGK